MSPLSLDDLTRKSMQMLLLDIWSNKNDPDRHYSISEACFMSDRVIILSPRPGRIARIISSPLAGLVTARW
jgi:NitT/TauT family transport system ATP-binding protein